MARGNDVENRGERRVPRTFDAPLWAGPKENERYARGRALLKQKDQLCAAMPRLARPRASRVESGESPRTPFAGSGVTQAFSLYFIYTPTPRIKNNNIH